jgi:hypothetical protein
LSPKLQLKPARLRWAGNASLGKTTNAFFAQHRDEHSPAWNARERTSIIYICHARAHTSIYIYSLCPVRACLAPISPQSLHMGLAPSELVPPPPSAHRALCYSMLYIKTVKKTKSVKINFTLAASRFKKMRFSKIANLGNAPAIHNQNIIVKICQSPPAAHQQPTEPTQSVCPVRACLAPISPQSSHMVFAPSELVFPSSAHRALCHSMLYIKTVKKKKIG